MKWLAAGLIFLHGLIHFLGVAKGFGFAEVRELVEPVSSRAAVLWLVAGVAMVGAAVLYLASPRIWWVLGLLAVALSQTAVLGAWSDAKFGTLANLVVLLLALYGLASEGPFSLRSQYRDAVQARLATPVPSGSITENDLADLPEPVRRYVTRAGAVGQPRVTRFRATWSGRIRGAPDEPWMDFTAQQVNVVDPPARFFSMKARRSGLPVDVLHAFEDEGARMDVRLLSAVPLVRAEGGELTRAETVTLLNDLAVLAPGALLDPRITWEAIDDRRARARYTIGSNTISAELIFSENGALVDFVSDDRSAASSDGTDFVRQRWSTPLSDERTFGPLRVASHGEGRWHPDSGDAWVYIELDLTDLEMNPTR